MLQKNSKNFHIGGPLKPSGVLAYIRTMDLTNTGALNAWFNLYGGSYARTGTMNVFDYQGVLQASPANILPVYGGRLTGGVWYNTEADGTTAITGTMLGAFWPSTTNACPATEGRDFSHANWAKTNGSVSAGAVVLIDGTTVSDKNTFTASGADATIIKTAYVLGADDQAGGVFIKRKTGTGKIYITMDNGAGWTEVTSTVGATWTTLSKEMTQSLANPQFGVKVETSGDAIYLDWHQMAEGAVRVPSHPVEPGTTLAAQTLIAASAANAHRLIDDTQGYVLTSAQLLPDDLSLLLAGIVNRGGFPLYTAAGTNTLQSYDGTSVLSLAGAVVGSSNVISYWWDSTKQLTSNGVSSLTGAYDGSFGTGAIYIGNRSAGTASLNGGIATVEFGVKKKIIQAQAEALAPA